MAQGLWLGKLDWGAQLTGQGMEVGGGWQFQFHSWGFKVSVGNNWGCAAGSWIYGSGFNLQLRDRSQIKQLCLREFHKHSLSQTVELCRAGDSDLWISFCENFILTLGHPALSKKNRAAVIITLQLCVIISDGTSSLPCAGPYPKYKTPQWKCLSAELCKNPPYWVDLGPQ